MGDPAREALFISHASPEDNAFTLDACRHGGMTELEEAELTDGQGRALSGHRSQRAYEAMPSGRWSGLY